MATGARSKRLSAPTLAAAGGAVVLTVPAGRQWIVKTIAIANESGVSGNVELTLNSPNAGVNRLHRVLVPGDGVAHLVQPMVFNTNDVLRAFAATGLIRVTVFGADLAA